MKWDYGLINESQILHQSVGPQGFADWQDGGVAGGVDRNEESLVSQ